MSQFHLPKHKPLRPTVPKREGVVLNASGTEMTVPGIGKQPVVGIDPRRMDKKQAEHAHRKALLERQMASEFKCLQCKKVTMGTRVRVKVMDINGTKTEVLVCPDLTCDGPVILWRDALSLTNPPGGDRGAV